jgi:formyltetrahydrofolate deformylase
VVSNHETLRDVCGHFDVPFTHIAVDPTAKANAEAVQLQLLEQNGVDLVVLARYMQVLSPTFVERWPSQIINIHHSFLPAFVGARPYHQAKERGVKLIGATAHYVTAELDQGPIIEQDVCRVSHRDEVPDLVQKGRELERQVLTRAVRLHLRRRVLVFGNRTIVFS